MTRSVECKPTEGCKRCQANPRSVCVACTQRRRRAMALREQDGLSVAQIAERMKLTVARVERLLEEEAQFRDLQQYICDAVPVEVIQALVRQRQEEDPELTQDELARECGYKSRIGLLRVLGLAPTAKVRRRGKEYPPQLRTEIDVETASRIARALGFVPREIPGL